ncbi:MAG: LapA family protein [Acidimicrobiia bacterium]
MPDNDRPIKEASSRDIGALIRLTLAGALVLLLAAFAIDNRTSVRVGWVFGDFEAPMIVILLATALGGALIGWLVLSRARRAGGRKQRNDQD